jgi:hypothetical protein
MRMGTRNDTSFTEVESAWRIKYGGRSEFLWALWDKVNTNSVYNKLNVHTKYIHTVHDRCILKDFELFRDRSVRELYERLIYHI